MKRVMMVDDERPVLDGISLMIRRDLASEFEIQATASSGREAIERIPALAPDIVLMDVSMPGISGLDAIREIRKRESKAVFILVTAYERFDIAREAVELGVIDYLLKPVARDKLALALRAAASHLDQLGQSTQSDVAWRERELKLKQFVERAFLHGIMLGEDQSPDLVDWQEAMETQFDQARIACAVFLAPPGALDGPRQIRECYGRYCSVVRFKTSALIGPLVGGRSLTLFWVRSPQSAERELGDFREAISQTMGNELRLGLLRIGVGSIENLADLGQSWQAAMADLLARPYRSPESFPENPGSFDFETDSAFLDEIQAGDLGRARIALDRLFFSWKPDGRVSVCERYRVISLLSTACRLLVQRGFLPMELAATFLDLRALHDTVDIPSFRIQAERMLQEMGRHIGDTPFWSVPVARTIAWIREQYGSALSLESAADLCGISASRLSKLFIAETGQGFSEYLISYRIARAKELLAMPGASIKQVSIQCGYPDPNYFARLFKKETEITPSAFAAGKTGAVNE